MANAHVRNVSKRIFDVTGVPRSHYESFQVLKYGQGQKYNTHHDNGGDEMALPCGPRILTFFVYLSDVEEGGETLLPLADDGLKVHGCVDCERKHGASVDWREDACTGCVKPRRDEMLENCGSATNSGVVATPQIGRLVLW
jgi:hypothetical protein